MTKMSETLTLDEGFITITTDGLEKIIRTVEQRIKAAISKDPHKYIPRFYIDDVDDDYDFYTVKEASIILKVAQVTVRNLCNEGKLTYSIPSKRTILISKNNLKKYLNSVTYGE